MKTLIEVKTLLAAGFVPYGDDEEDGSGRAICGCADGSYVGYNYLIGQEPRRHPDGSVTHCRVVRVDSTE